MKFTQFENKHVGIFGGCYVPEMLIYPLLELEAQFFALVQNPDFENELRILFKEYIGRPTPLYRAKNFETTIQKQYPCFSKIYFKQEYLAYTGAHKINNALGQAVFAKRMGKKCLIAETGAGQHGLAVASIAARFGFDCRIFMGEKDMQRQYPNVFLMRQMGADVIPVCDGARTLKNAVNAAMKDWIEKVEYAHYVIGSAVGPFPYPVIVQYFQSIIGEEIAQQCLEYGFTPKAIVSCVGGGSNSLGAFTEFLESKRYKKTSVELIGVEAGGTGKEIGKNAIRFADNACLGIIQGYKSYFIQTKDGQVSDTSSISAGLDYAGVSPQVAYYHDKGRIRMLSCNDDKALHYSMLVARTEGILPALESSHVFGAIDYIAEHYGIDDSVVFNISGRGDKDLFILASRLDKNNFHSFLNDEIHR